MTVPQAVWTLIGLGVLSAFLCAASDTWREIFRFGAIVGILVGAAYAALWCVALGVRAIWTLLHAAGWIA